MPAPSFSVCCLCALVLLSLRVSAQQDAPAASTPITIIDCTHPFGLDDNMELVYAITDKNGKAAGTLRQRVVRLGSEPPTKQGDTTYTVLLKSGRYDKHNRLMRMQDITYACRRDTSFTDGMSEIEYHSLASFRGRRLEYAPVPLPWPNYPTTGSALTNGGVEIDVSSSVVDIATVSTTVRQRRILSGPEALTTPAGTFQVYIIESEREARTAPRPDMALSTKTRVVDYYAPGVGIVKTEIFDKKGKLEQAKILQARNPGNQ